METLTVRLQVYAGGPKPITFQDWSTFVDTLRPAFDKAGIALSTDAKHFEQFAGSMIAIDDAVGETDPIKRESNLAARIDYARQHFGYLSVFLASGAPYNYGRGDFGVLIRLVGDLKADGTIHEFGHTLNLHHSFAEGWCDEKPGGSTPNTIADAAEAMFPDLLAKANNDVGVALIALRRKLERMLDGDSAEGGDAYGVSDTPFSIHEIHGTDNLAHMNDANFTMHVDFNATVPGKGKAVQRVDLVPDRSNYMGYWGAPFRNRFSQQQVNRMRSTLTRGSLLRVSDPFNGYIDPTAPAVSAINSLFDGAGFGVFDIAADQRVRLRTKLKDQTLWSRPIDLGGRAAGRPTTCSGPTGATFVFIRDPADGSIWVKYGQNGIWPGGLIEWTALGGKTLMNPECVADGAGGVMVFATGTDNKLYVNVSGDGQGAKWSGWIGLGGDLAAAPAIVATGPNQIEVVATFNDSSVRTKSFDGKKWTPGQLDWTSLGGDVRHRPAVASWAPGRIDVFVVGKDDALYSKLRENGSWWPGVSEWHQIGATEIDLGGNAGKVVRGERVWSTPLLFEPKVGELQVWAVDMRTQNLIRNLWTKEKNGYGGWQILDGHLAGPLAGVMGSDGQPQIVARFCDGTTWHRTVSQNWARVDELQQT